jgi:hypothetical protein
MKTNLLMSRMLIPALALGLASGVPFVLAQPDMPMRAPLAHLKTALQNAGAQELTTEQENSIEALITEFRNSHQRAVQSEEVKNASAAYEDAILRGDSAAAASQAEILGRAQAAAMVQRESDAASFAINVINILRADPGQADALITQMGTRGFVRMILNLVGGPGRPGGLGPRGRRPPLPPGFAAP